MQQDIPLYAMLYDLLYDMWYLVHSL